MPCEVLRGLTTVEHDLPFHLPLDLSGREIKCDEQPDESSSCDETWVMRVRFNCAYRKQNRARFLAASTRQ